MPVGTVDHLLVEEVAAHWMPLWARAEPVAPFDHPLKKSLGFQVALAPLCSRRNSDHSWERNYGKLAVALVVGHSLSTDPCLMLGQTLARATGLHLSKTAVVAAYCLVDSDKNRTQKQKSKSDALKQFCLRSAFLQRLRSPAS